MATAMRRARGSATRKKVHAALPLVPAESARRLLLAGQGLAADPGRRATPARVYKQIERMGFVQIDTINVVARAHDHVLYTRFDGYRPAMLDKLVARDRKLFEHWTHDLSVIPMPWVGHWKLRFDGHKRRMDKRGFWHERLGRDRAKLLARVKDRIRDEGPLLSRDFEVEEPKVEGHWWSGKPTRLALEYLWRAGEILVSKRVNFQKAFDLAERVVPDLEAIPTPTPAEHVDWACRAAIERLVVATPGDLSKFWDGIPARDASAWCRRAVEAGELIEVKVEAVDGSAPRRAVALPDWETRARKAPATPERTRLLSPFDPVIRDRARLKRLFGFDYIVEIFVPPAKRKWGYYVLPILEGERIVGRLDPKLDRDRGVLEVSNLWWEPGVQATRARRRGLEDALTLLCEQIGARDFTLPR